MLNVHRTLNKLTKQCLLSLRHNHILDKNQDFYIPHVYKKSPANAEGNPRQRCMCEGPVRTKSYKLIMVFRLDSTADDA